MSMNDPIADFLTRVRNAASAGHDKADIPSSRLKQAIVKIIKEEGYIKNFRLIEDQGNWYAFVMCPPAIAEATIDGVPMTRDMSVGGTSGAVIMRWAARVLVPQTPEVKVTRPRRRYGRRRRSPPRRAPPRRRTRPLR